ncbi:MAG: DNA-3-methyladenine glycosylase I [Halomonadaceae bacterium]|nr:MAG: DNA-3-methyladenine glycosylase I [Halomonadaceae bacterium]
MTEPQERCPWCGDAPDYVAYHDQVWGRPVADPLELFAKLCLDGQQAGLSWLTILRKQANYRAAFADFDPDRLAHFNHQDVERLMQNTGIVRNRLKIQSILKNAAGYRKMRSQGQNFAHFLWSFVDGRPQINHFASFPEIPTETAASQAMSRALKQHGFNFVGPTICYAFMQAVGMVNDHLTGCPQRAETLALSRSFQLPPAPPC